MNTKINYLLFISFSFTLNLNAQLITPNPLILQWEYLESNLNSGNVTEELDAQNLQGSHNQIAPIAYFPIFEVLPATFGIGLKRDINSNGFGGCAIIYDGLLAGTTGCTNKDYAIGARSWTFTNEKDKDDYFEFAVNANKFDCLNLSNALISVSFDAQKSGTGPNTIDVEYQINNNRFITVPGLQDLIIDDFTNYQSSSDFLSLPTDLNRLSFRVFGYNATSNNGSLRVDNFKIRIENLGEVNQNIPIFPEIPTLCVGEPSPLNTISSNGISGSWTPNFDTTNTATYTFNPDDGQCAAEVTLQIEIEKGIIPIFDTILKQCEEQSSPLANTSTNGISGIWSPTFDSKNTTTYLFTPNENECAEEIVQTIEIENCGCGTTEIDLVSICVGDDYTYPDGSEGEKETGTYNRTQVVNINQNCTKTIVTELRVGGPVFPTAFSPNSSKGMNDEFKLINNSCSIENYELQIFNRWGEKVFETVNKEEAWNGKSEKHTSESNQVFLYFATFSRNGNDIVLKGVVSKLQ